MNKITNKNGQFLSAEGEAATSAFAIRTLMSAIKLKQQGISVRAGLTKNKLLMAAANWLGEKPKNLDEAMKLLQVKMTEKVAQCEIVEAKDDVDSISRQPH